MAKELAGPCYPTPTSGPLDSKRPNQRQSVLTTLKGLPREKQRGRIAARVKYWRPPLAIFALSASLALVEDFKTTNGKEYKNATVSQVEPDGIVLKTKSGISKVYFVELPKEVQERFHYDPEKAAAAFCFLALPLFELARVLVRLDHVARHVVKANHWTVSFITG